jgi:hypothetical protein
MEEYLDGSIEVPTTLNDDIKDLSRIRHAVRIRMSRAIETFQFFTMPETAFVSVAIVSANMSAVSAIPLDKLDCAGLSVPVVPSRNVNKIH